MSNVFFTVEKDDRKNFKSLKNANKYLADQGFTKVYDPSIKENTKGMWRKETVAPDMAALFGFRRVQHAFVSFDTFED